MSEAGRDRKVVYYIEHRHGYDRSDIEPNCYVETWLVTFRERPKEVNRKYNPDEHHGNIDWPDEFGVFFSSAKPER